MEKLIFQDKVPVRPTDRCRWILDDGRENVNIKEISWFKATDWNPEDHWYPIGLAHGTRKGNYKLFVVCKESDHPNGEQDIEPPKGYELVTDPEYVIRDGDMFAYREYGGEEQLIRCRATVGHKIKDVFSDFYGAVFLTPIKQKESKDMDKICKTIASKTFSLAKSQANHWLIEPTTNILKVVMWSVRYVILCSGVTAAIYGYNNPEQAKDLAYSMMPKVSFSVEAPDILK